MVDAAHKFAVQQANLNAYIDKQIEPALVMLKQATAMDASPALKAYDLAVKASADHSRLLVDFNGINDALKFVTPESLGLTPGWKDVLASLALPTFDPSLLERLRAEADGLEEELEADHVEQSVQEFFENQPELAEEIDNLPVVRATLNQEDREKVVKFIRVIIWICTFCIIYGVSSSNPVVAAVLSAVGFGANTVYGKSEDHVRRLVDRIADDPDGGAIKGPLWEE